MSATAVERLAVGVGEGRLGHSGQHRERGTDVDQPGVVVHEAGAATPAPLSTSGARDWITSSEPCSPMWPPASRNWCRGVCTIARSGLRSASAKNDRSRAAAYG